MAENMKDWDALRTPPATALKEIKGGRLSGKSDINPQWRWQRMTEVYGPIGFGWRWEHVEHWAEKGAEDQVMCFVRVAVRVKRGTEWSEPVYGTGGSFLVEKEGRGPYTNDEAYKMAETDALGNACKYLGLAADVFLGMMDGSKYAKPAPTQQAQPRQQPAPSVPPALAMDAPICHCGDPCKQAIVRSGKNAGKPFFACMSRKGKDDTNGCDFFEWAAPARKPEAEAPQDYPGFDEVAY